VSTITHVVLAVVLTLFLAAQARSFVFVMRCRREAPRCRRPSDVLWTAIPLLIVLALAARSWVTVFDLQRAAAAAAVSATAQNPGPFPR